MTLLLSCFSCLFAGFLHANHVLEPLGKPMKAEGKHCPKEQIECVPGKRDNSDMPGILLSHVVLMIKICS